MCNKQDSKESACENKNMDRGIDRPEATRFFRIASISLPISIQSMKWGIKWIANSSSYKILCLLTSSELYIMIYGRPNKFSGSTPARSDLSLSWPWTHESSWFDVLYKWANRNLGEIDSCVSPITIRKLGQEGRNFKFYDINAVPSKYFPSVATGRNKTLSDVPRHQGSQVFFLCDRSVFLFV